MDWQRHLAAGRDKGRHGAGLWRGTGSFIGIVIIQGRHVRVDEDLVHPLTADIVRGAFKAGHHRDTGDGLARRVPVGDHKAGKARLIGRPAAGQDGVHFPLRTDQQHAALVALDVAGEEEVLPQKAGTVSKDQMENGRHGDDDPAVGAGPLHDEEDQHQAG